MFKEPPATALVQCSEHRHERRVGVARQTGGIRRVPFPLRLFVPWLLLVLLVIGSTQEEASTDDQKSCREQAPARSLLQQAQDTTQTYAERKKAYESAAQACSYDPSIYSALTALLLEHQEGESALKWARRGLAMAPENPNLIVYEGVALLLVGHPDEAVAVLKRAPPKGKNEFYLGMAYRALREPQKAQQALSQAFTTGFNDPYVLYALIEQDRALGDKEAGLRDFRTFYEHFPNSPWLHMLHGDAYMSRNVDSNAEAEYEQVLKLAPNLPVVHFQLGSINFKRANYSAAEDHFRKEIAIDPTLAASYLYLGATLRRLGKNSEALPFLEQAMVRDPNNTLAYSALATAQNEAGKPEGALRTLSAGEKRFPREAAFPAQLAALLRRLGRPEQAKKEAEKATWLSRQNNPIKHGVATGANTLVAPPNTSKIQTTPEPAPQAGPSPPLAGNPRRAVGDDLGGPGGKDSQPADWDSLAPVLAPLYRCVERSDSSCANKALAQIQGPVRDSPDYLALEARAFALERRKDEAFAAINRAVEMSPRQYRYLMTQGEIYQSFNDQASAIRSFLLADQARPHSTKTFYFLGMSFFFLEEYPRAEKHFLQAIELDPKNHRATFMLGVSKMITFKLNEAKGYFEQALKLQPDNPFYHLHYGILLGRMGDKGSAIEQARTAERLDPSYALTHYSLGHLYKESGDYQAAKEELEIAIRSRPGLAEAYYQLGFVYQHLGMAEDSRKAYQEFQKLMTEEKQKVLVDPVESNVLRHEP
jgi:tetratricopeptide (TPR) repeat protein